MPIQEVPRLIYSQPTCRPAGQCDCGDCDCACNFSPSISREAGSENQIGTVTLEQSPFVTTALDNDDVVYCSQIGFPVVLNHSAQTLLALLSEPHSLGEIPRRYSQSWGKEAVQSTLSQMLGLGLLQRSDDSSPSLCSTEKPGKLAAWLHLTSRCDLDCDYCYVSRTPGEMSSATGRTVINASFRSALAHGYSTIKLKYAGGEPLLEFHRITELHRYAQTLAQRFGLQLDGVVLSNGTLLTPEMVKTMQALDLRLMISLDGLGEFHNCHRHFIDGRDSFNSVVRSIDLALSCGLIPDISITLSGRNAEGLPELIAWVLKRDLPFSVNFYRENDLSAPHSDLVLDEEHIITSMLAAYAVIENHLPHRSLLASLADRANLSFPHLNTCSVGRDYLVFDPQGRVAKCQMDMETIITDCNDFDPLSTVRASSDGIWNPTVDEKVECRDCEWRYWCTGGCPLIAYCATGHYDAKSPNCSIYQALYPEVIRLEGLRLLKYADRLDDIITYQPKKI